ncbi:MAG: transcriptional regulator [Alphaproteobacteria bacterium]
MRKVLRDVHEAARDLAKSGVLPETTMREFDALCLPAVKAYGAKNVRRIRRKERVSQTVFAHYLNVGRRPCNNGSRG